MKGYGTISMWRTRRPLPAIALSMILASCTTTPTTDGKISSPPTPTPGPAQTNNVPTGRFVPCPQISIVKFNAPDPDHPVDESAANIFDTPETISPTRKNNAAIREACGK